MVGMAAALSIAPAITFAHEVRPAIMDVARAGDALRAEVTLNAEAILAGVDLGATADTDEAPPGEAAAYDALRALAPAEVAARLEASWDAFAQALVLDGAGAPAFVAAETLPAEGGGEAPRETRVTFAAPAPGPVRVGWAGEYGELILRETPAPGQDPAETFAALLAPGEISPPLLAANAGQRGLGVTPAATALAATALLALIAAVALVLRRRRRG